LEELLNPTCSVCHQEILAGNKCGCTPVSIITLLAPECGVESGPFNPIPEHVAPNPLAELQKELSALKAERSLAQAVLAQLHDNDWIGQTVHHLQSVKMRSTGYHGPNDRCGESIPNSVGIPYPCGALIGGKPRYCARCVPSLVEWDKLPWHMKDGYSTSMVELLSRTEEYVKEKVAHGS